MVFQVDEALLNSGNCVEGDTVDVVAGSPPGIPGSTNGLRVHHVGDALNKVAPAYEDLD
jgi:pyruvate kinase